MAESKASSTVSKSDEKKQTVTKDSQDKTEGEASSSGSDVSGHEDENNEDDKQIGKGVATATIAVNREEYLQAHRDLCFDRGQLQIKNNLLHRRLGDYYKKRKMVHVLKPLEGSEDLEEKYQQKLFNYQDFKEKAELEMADIKSKLQVVELQYNGRQADAAEKFEVLQHLERSTGSGLIYSKKGKPISDKTVARFLTLQKRKQEQSTNLCMRYIRARNAVGELDAVVKKLEKIGPGLYVYQFEQLHIDNQNLMTKVEEREDELIKNRAKCTEHNQILAHIREKMNHTDEVIDFAECDLGDAEIEFTDAREELGSIKTRRDRLRYALDSERLKAGLLTRKDLLRDFQDASDEVLVLRKKKKCLEERIEICLRKLREARKRMQADKTPHQASSLSFF